MNFLYGQHDQTVIFCFPVSFYPPFIRTSLSGTGFLFFSVPTLSSKKGQMCLSRKAKNMS